MSEKEKTSIEKHCFTCRNYKAFPSQQPCKKCHPSLKQRFQIPVFKLPKN